jgi:hypothetical protein
MSDKPERPKNKNEAEKPLPPGDKDKVKEIGGRKGPEPTRYGDWERKGILSDF